MNRALWILGAVLLTLPLPGCDSDSPTESTPPDPPGPEVTRAVKGVALSPAGFPETFDEFPAFIQEASSLPDAGVMWNGPWRDDVLEGSDAGQLPEAARVIAMQAEPHGYSPILVFGWRGPEQPHIRIPDNPVNHWGNEDAAALYVDVVANMASEHSPPFLFLGNESDLYFDQDPEDYQRWVEVYETAYSRIKEVSPETRVGPIFQYERMAGIGALAAQTTESWGALTAHDLDRVDMVGITLYPFFAHETPAAVPDDYLDPLASRIGDTPIAITETGWPAETPEGFQPPWEASETHQVTFLATLERVLSGKEVPLVTWVWLHPPAAPTGGGLTPLEWNIFSSLSLRRASGEKRPVYAAWRDFSLESP